MRAMSRKLFCLALPFVTATNLPLAARTPHDANAIPANGVQFDPADANRLTVLGHELLRQGYPISAESACRQALLLHPQCLNAKLVLLKSLLQQDRHPEVLSLCGEILRDDPLRGEIWSLRVQTLMTLGRHDEAARAIEQSRRLACADGEMLALLGDLHLQRNQPEDALRMYGISFMEQAPEMKRVLHALEGFLLVGDSQGAERMIEISRTLRDAGQDAPDPDEACRLLRLQAEAARQQGNVEQAITYGKSGLMIHPLDGELLLLLARLLQDSGQMEDAVMMCERAARIRGHEAEALVQQAQIEVARQRYASAVQLLEAAQIFHEQPHVRRYLEQVRRVAQDRRNGADHAE